MSLHLPHPSPSAHLSPSFPPASPFLRLLSMRRDTLLPWEFSSVLPQRLLCGGCICPCDLTKASPHGDTSLCETQQRPRFVWDAGLANRDTWPLGGLSFSPWEPHVPLRWPYVASSQSCVPLPGMPLPAPVSAAEAHPVRLGFHVSQQMLFEHFLCVLDATLGRPWSHRNA